MAAPTLPDIKTYLGDRASSWSDAELTEVLATETAAQASVCRASALGLADVRGALLRRIDRNLAMRALPLGVQQSDAGGVLIGSNDPEVRRLEKPHRKLPKG